MGHKIPGTLPGGNVPRSRRGLLEQPRIAGLTLPTPLTFNGLSVAGVASGLWLLALAGFAPQTLAYETGDILLRAGYARIEPDLDSDVAVLGELELGEIGTDPIDTGVITFSYFLSNHFALETMLSVPPTFDIRGTSGLLDDIPIGDVEVLPLVLIAQYYPLAPASRWQPYIGAGVNYVLPDKVSVDPELAPIFGAEKVDIEIDNSVGLVLSLGLDFMLTDNLTLSAGAYYADVKAEGTANIVIGGQGLAIDLFGHTRRQPVLYTISIGYIFPTRSR